MPDPFRLRVHKALTVVLEGAVYTDYRGTVTPMTGRVKRGRAVFGEETPVPLLSILESPIPQDPDRPPVRGTTFQGDWELVVQGFVPDDEDNPTDPAHILMAEVKKVLAEEKAKSNLEHGSTGILGFDGLVDDLYIGPGVVRPPDELSDKAYFWLTLTLKVIEDYRAPYG